VFLEERLKVAKANLDDASNQLAQFSSKNTRSISSRSESDAGRGGTIAGQMIAAQSELEASHQIYTDNNSRVRSLNARVAELRKQLEKLGGTETKNANRRKLHRPANPLIQRPRRPVACPIHDPEACPCSEQSMPTLPPGENTGNRLRTTD